MKSYLKYELIFNNADEFFIENLSCFLIENFKTTLETVCGENGERYFLYLKHGQESIFKIIENYTKCFNINVKVKFLEKLDDSYLFKWKENYKPVTIDNITIVPSWNKKSVKSDIVIEIDPQTAFGTGHHETTKLAIQAINKINRDSKNFSFLDVGTGSGILSIVAGKNGVKNIVAIDNDPEAVKVAKENFLKNRVKDVSLICGNDLCLKKDINFDMVVANIISSVLLNMKDFLKDKTAQNRFLILSGILKDEIINFKNIFDFKRFDIINEICLNEWCCIIAKKTF